jgi:predicted phosphodiesterase
LIFAIISDVHANLEAAQACFKKINEIKPDKIICLGDLVDYCAEPNEVIDIVRTECDKVILGNHDEAQFNHLLAEGFSENAYISSLHTRDIINKEQVDYLHSLPYTYSEEDLFFVHGSPKVPKKYQYVLNEEAAKINFGSFKEKICFIGHSHIPVMFENRNGEVKDINTNKLDKNFQYIINVGSVGQPRDNDPRLCFGIFDTEKFEFKYERIIYNIESASKKILADGLPQFLAERLYLGI